MTADLDALLQARGILDMARSAGWTAHEHLGRAGWSFPIFNINGNRYPNLKWKSADGDAPKCAWLPGKPDGAKYYFLPGTLSEIANRHGGAYLASGEPDVLAFQAAGIKNVFCWLDGENSIPDTLISNLLAMNVGMLTYYPDRDQTGLQAAHKLAGIMRDADLTLVLYQLPGDVGSKYDINKLWQDCQFDAAEFRRRLDACPEIDPVDLYLYARAPKVEGGATKVDADYKAWRKAWTAEIIQAMGTPALVEQGRNRWHCPMPGHPDTHASFRFSDNKSPGFLWPVCSCGIQDDKQAWDTLAELKGVDSWADYKKARAAEQGYSQQVVKPHTTPLVIPNSTDQIAPAPRWVDSHAIYVNLRANLLNPAPVNSLPPIPFPFKVFHPYGGYAKFMRHGKLTAITGVSGGLKTTLARSFTQVLNEWGHDVIWWGPEWTPEEYGEADLQRAGGLDLDQQDTLALWKEAECMGPDAVRKLSAEFGLTRPTESEVQRSVAVIDSLLKVPGYTYYIPDMAMPLMEVLKLVREITTSKRREGRTVSMFVLDYLQLINQPGEQDWKWGERVIGAVKTELSPLYSGLCGIITAQTRKGDAEQVWNGTGEVNQSSGQGFSDQKFNLYLAITPEFDEMKRPSGILKVKIAKNSRAKTDTLRLMTHPNRSAILDRIAPLAAIPTPHRNGNGAGESVDHAPAPDGIYRGGDS